ncbi:MAG: hypothetical protein IJE81_03955 [Oscillospiraceae bacterium]|nr:hypothetical protein [Oscillospiraceae bacterium]MBQ7129539.1 hypothetical protein [Oscillospiraceae bacterium]
MSDFDRALQEALRLSGTPEGKQLVSMLQQLGGGDLQQTLDRASAGDLHQAQQLISSLMRNPQARQLLQQLGGSYGK